jgi:cell division protein ZipA|tara:strand:+ start:154 stop:1077 length:924 start_codon:yes stop_codon:yes gene_type:complete
MLVEWITVITVLLIVGILLDGWRRMRNNHRGSIKMARNLPQSSADDSADHYGSELPSGGARVVSVRDIEETDQCNQNLHDNFSGRQSSTQPSYIPEQVALNLEESVPMLMDVDDLVVDPVSAVETDPASARLEPSFDSGQRSNDVPLTTRDSTPHPPSLEAPDDVIVINVMARKGKCFDGQLLMEVLLDCDMRFGDMDIFHRHEQPDGEGVVLFSMVNMIKPGCFSLSDTRCFETPGVSLFMTLPIKADAMTAFTTMAATAHKLQTALGAELKDEDRSVMTLQTLEHCRERICEHQRKLRLEKRTAI